MTTKGKRPTILVVDDESAVRETLGMILTHNGFEVTLAGTVGYGSLAGFLQP